MVAIQQISNNNSENPSTDKSDKLDKEVTGTTMEDKSIDSTEATEASAKTVATETTPATQAKPKAKAKAKKAAKATKSKSKADASNAKLFAGNTHLKTTLQQIEKQFGEGSIMPLGSAKRHKIEGIPTGSLSLDMALGGQGIPRGRIIEIFGPESSGKTTIALHVAAEAQKAGGIAAMIDAEHSFDPSWAKKLGIELDTLLVSQPSHGEEAMQITEMLVKSNAVDVIIIDSVAALIPRRELEGEIGDSHVGLQARLMSQSMRKLTGAIAKSKTAVIFINQIRIKIGVMFGNPETTSGGNALKFYASVRLDIRRIGQIKDRDSVVGNHTRVKVVKNKVAPPFKVVEFDIMYGEGISKTGELLDHGVNVGIIEKSGSWFSHDSQRIGQGRENAKRFLRDHPDMADAIERSIREKAGLLADVMLDGVPADVMLDGAPNDTADDDAALNGN